MTPDCSKMLLRIAVPPPQQKFFPFSSSMVTTGAFHAASSAVGRLPRLGRSQRMVVVARVLTSPDGHTRGVESRISVQAPPHIAEPLPGLSNEVHAHQDLQEHEKVK